MAKRLYTFDIVKTVRGSIGVRLRSRLEQSVEALQRVRVSRENYEVVVGRVLSAGSKEEKDGAVSDAIVYLRGLRRELASVRELLDAAEVSLVAHADFETLLFAMEKDASDGQPIANFSDRTYAASSPYRENVYISPEDKQLLEHMNEVEANLRQAVEERGLVMPSFIIPKEDSVYINTGEQVKQKLVDREGNEVDPSLITGTEEPPATSWEPVQNFFTGNKYGGMSIEGQKITLWEEELEVSKTLPDNMRFCQSSDTGSPSQNL